MLEDHKTHFVNDFIELLRDTEVPPIFALWSALATVSGALGRRVWLDMGVFNVFPNSYIILVAGSGRCRKSTAINMAEKILRQVEPNPNIISQKVTPEALIESMKVLHTDDEKTLFRETCGGVIVVDELATFLNRRNYESGLGPLLTTFWDCKDEFEYRTRGRGVEKISNSYLTVIGGSTIEWIREAVPIDAIGGGVTSRMLFIYSDEPGQPIPRPIFSPQQKNTMERLVREIKRIATIEGEMRLSPAAAKLHDAMYYEFFRTSAFFDNKLMSGYASRRFVHLLKISMMLAIVDTNELIIQPTHIEYADRILTLAETRMLEVLNLITQTETGDINKEVFDTIHKTKGISKSDLIDKFSNRLSAKEFEDILQTLLASQRVSMEIRATKVLYKVTTAS